MGASSVRTKITVTYVTKCRTGIRRQWKGSVYAWKLSMTKTEFAPYVFKTCEIARLVIIMRAALAVKILEILIHNQL